ncbi:DEAD/DEAH box helicase [Azospirillum rugosum]|uniref:Superfamily II DNA/RNA helicase n=1 Tax=Azospirillum rugosum TaxID=416170 RepID=A0ABS4SIE4_9PROT|nr:DEAD/DEAH box helicase [Azospirillum rugosum]MBP2292338.1 superfamily II DNA/RNA helicase [Azospirillum rugosum]MDQ0526097.1 superfamily II DNA/RNA helicase [Azospirillum rugosum]
MSSNEMTAVVETPVADETLAAAPATEVTDIETAASDSAFAALGLHPLVLKALEAYEYTTPTPVQAAAIPHALEGRDILATAETGTGKTAAFMLPALTRTAELPRMGVAAPRVLVLAPTRELAKQVTDAARKYAKFMKRNIVDVVGGMPYRDQLRLLSRAVDVMVATPGRLLDHVSRNRIDLSTVEVLILDEADRMLDMGFLDDVETIAKCCPESRQTLLFTATLDRRMAQLAGKLLRNPERVAVESTTTAANVEQRLHHADDMDHKRRLLMHFAGQEEVGKAIIFAATKRDADTLAEELAAAGHAAAALHGDMDQFKRNRTLQRLRTGQVRLLVATDVAARGIDVRDITHVINFDLPRSAEDYVHRIGRTGRAGASGVAISFAARPDRDALFRIERYTGIRLEIHTVPGLEPQRPIHAGGGGGRPAGRSGRPGGGNGGGGYNKKPWTRNANGGEGKAGGGHPGGYQGRPQGRPANRNDHVRNEHGHSERGRPDHGHARRDSHGGKPVARATKW